MHYITGISTSNNLQNLSYGYDKFGNLARRTDSLRMMTETFEYDKLNRLTDITLGNGSSTHRHYTEDMHYIDSIVTTNNLQNLSYGYDKFGNLASRKDNLRNLEETFLYDNMNRLTDIFLGNTHSQIVYDPLGRMTDKEADGQTVFANADFTGVAGQPTRPHAMKSAETTEDAFPAATQNIAYTSFDKVKAIVEDSSYIIYTYGYDQQRIHLTESVDEVMRLKEYVGVCEFVTDDYTNNCTQRSFTYLVGPYGVFAVVEKQGDEESIHYVLKDHLGSWTTITDAEGVVEQELSFGAWGELRDPDTWSGGFSGTPMFDRGFTGHEHITAFGIINMNGRCYDPLTSSFLSVDAYVQDPTSAQSFNRYAYCMHNPLRYTDPTGWLSGPGRSDAANLNHSHDETARWQSEDINDVLWGRSVHPCETGNPYWTNSTFTTYTQGNESDRCNTQLSCLSKPIKTEEGYYLNILNGRIEYSPGGENLLYNDGLLYMTSLDATIGDIEDVLNRWNLSYTTDPNIEGRYLVNTETYIKGWMLWRSMPVMATYFAGMTVESFISAISQIKNAKYYTVEPKKYDYFFGKVASNSHNATRSIQNEKALRELGITNKQQINRIFDRAITEGNIIKTQTTNYGTVITRQVEIGKSGCIDVGFFYENSNMLSIPKVITIIPKIY